MPARKSVDLHQLLLEASDQIKEQTIAPNIKKYVPHEKQHVFHSSDKKRKLYIGGNRSGKTTGGVCEGVWRATKTHPYRPELNSIIGPVRGRVVAVDFVQGIDKIIIPQYKQWTPPSYLRGGSWDTAFDRNARTLYFNNGSFIEFMSYDQDLDKFAGTSRHWVHFDEEPPRPIWVESLARLVDTNGEFWVTMTPVENMTWVYDELYEGQVGNPDGTVEVIEINTFENPYLTEEGIKGLMDVINDDDVAARIGGQFVSQGGRIYRNFDPTIGGDNVLAEPVFDPKAMFNERQWLWVLGLDHGLNNPTAALWIAFDPNGFGVVFDEYYKKDCTIEENAQNIKLIIAKHGRAPDLMVADPSIKNRSPINKVSIQQEYQKFGLNFKLGNNDVEAGIVRVKKYFNKSQYISSGHSRPVFYGGPQPGSDLSKWQPPKDNLFTKLLVSPKCQMLIWELKRYRWMTYTNKKLAFERNAYETPNKKDDHACDALRYVIMTRPDLQSTDLHTGLTASQEAMAQIDEKLGQTISADMGRIDDPNYSIANGHIPGFDGDVSPVDSGWDYDEHLGGLL